MQDANRDDDQVLVLNLPQLHLLLACNVFGTLPTEGVATCRTRLSVFNMGRRRCRNPICVPYYRVEARGQVHRFSSEQQQNTKELRLSMSWAMVCGWVLAFWAFRLASSSRSGLVRLVMQNPVKDTLRGLINVLVHLVRNIGGTVLKVGCLRHVGKTWGELLKPGSASNLIAGPKSKHCKHVDSSENLRFGSTFSVPA